MILVLCIALLSTIAADINPQQLFLFAGQQLQATANEVVDPTHYPISTAQSDAKWPWVTTGPSAWTSGFYPSSLWQLYNFTGDTTWKTLAESWTADISTQENNTSTHDVGFMVFYSFARGYELTGRLDYKAIALQAAHSLSTRYSPIVGCIRSWNGPGFQVIVDNMLNLELLFWAAANGGPQIYNEMAINHSDHTASNHIRKAGNSWHLVVYDPDTGAVLSQSNSPQGLDSPNGTWARGQGWAVYGFTMAFRYTKLQRYLDTAQLCANWFISNVPTDWVPLWDFAAPAGSPKDSSAAAIIASGLLELSKYVDEAVGQKYKQVAINILESLASQNYLATSSITPAILLHGVGSFPDNSQIDVSLTYGDYYFIEALLRLVNY